MDNKIPFCEEHSNIPKYIRYNIATKLSLNDLSKLCRTNKKCAQICQDEAFWSFKAHDDPFVHLSRPDNMSFKEWYQIIQNNNLLNLSFTDMMKFGVKNSYFRLVVYAIEHGADIHYYGDYVLIPAVKNKDLNMVIYLLKNGVVFTRRNSVVLGIAVQNGNTEMINLLLDYGININSSFPITAATLVRNLNMIKYLVNLGADPHINDDEALELAKEQGYSEIVDYLENLP